MLIVLLIIVLKIVLQSQIKLLMAVTLFVYFVLLTFVYKQLKYLYINVLL
jgi:hypothetical protein